MRNYWKVFAVILVFLVACAQVPAQPVPLAERSPQVTDVIPSENQLISTQPKFAVLFSRPLDPVSVHSQSVLLVKGDMSSDHIQSVSDIYKGIDKKSLDTLSLKYSLKHDAKELILVPDDQLQPSETYTLLITPRVLSREKVPLSQDASGSQNPVAVVYQTGGIEMVQTPDPIFDEVPEVMPQEVSDASSPTPVIQTPISNPVSTPAPIHPPSSPTPSSPVSPTSSPQGTVVINEIYYDAVGSDTDGVLFVELFGTAGMSLSGYKINFVNGSDGKIYDAITLPGSSHIRSSGFYVVADARNGSPSLTNVASADLIDSFDPQNGPDAVQLLNASGSFVDAVGYGQGIVARAENGLATLEGTAAPDVVNGHSLERSSPGQDTNNNSVDFVERETPTPGR